MTMRSPSRTLRFGLFALALVGAMAGCGGGSAPTDGAQAFATRVAQQPPAAQRKLSVTAGHPVDAKALLDWIEYKYPALFPRGPASIALDYEGKTYTIREYEHAAGKRYAGVTTQGEVYGLGDFTNNLLQSFGVLADFAAEIAADSCNVYPGSCPAAVAGLPADLLSRPAHPDCAALRSGTYRWLNPADSDPEWNTYLAQFDAPTGKITFPDGSVQTATSTGNCTFNASGTNIVVSPAGVIVTTSRNQNNQQVISVGFPEQAAALDTLAGISNWSSYRLIDSGPSGQRWRTGFGTSEFGPDGRQLSMNLCAGMEACIPSTSQLGSLQPNAAGGLDLVVPNDRTIRVFPYRPASADVTWFGVADGNLIVGTRQKSLPLPAVGDPLLLRTIEINWTGNAATSFTDSSGSVTAVDTATRTYTRTQTSGRTDVWNIDFPRFGLRYRFGSPTSAELLNMPLPGLGMTVYGAVVGETALNTGFFGFGVSR